MDRGKRDHLGSNRPKHGARRRRGDAGGGSPDRAPTESKIVLIGDFEAVRDALLAVLGPRGYRVAMARPPIVVSIKTTSRNATTDSEHEQDLEVRNEGTIVVFTPQTAAGKHFLHEVLYTDSSQWFGGAFCIDHRMAQDVIDEAASEGLGLNLIEVDLLTAEYSRL